jgi:hypothetical protein
MDHLEFAFTRRNRRTRYILQLKSIASGEIMMLVGSLLNWSSKPLDILKWDPSYFDVIGIESLCDALPLLAAHLYWRILTQAPIIVRSWFNDLKDKRLIDVVQT